MSSNMAICEASNTGLHPDLRRLQKAAGVLNVASPENDVTNTFELSEAFLRASASPLIIYRAASCLREGQLREVVQFLTCMKHACTSQVVARLLNIMQGLPGNWELALNFLESSPSSIRDQRVITLFALLGGRKTQLLLPWKQVIERAKDDEEARFSLCVMAERRWRGDIEDVFEVWDWTSQQQYAESTSVWRELQWAKYAQSLCIATVTGNYLRAMNDVDTPEFEQVPPLKYDVGRHFLRVCGHLMNRRNFHTSSSSSISGSDDESQLSNSPHNSIFVTPNLRKALHQIAQCISYGMPFILEGPTGCGKTSIISLLAHETMSLSDGRIDHAVSPGVTFIQMDSTMNDLEGESLASLIGEIVPLPNGAGFRWRAGPIGNAVERGEWLVFENLGKSTAAMSSSAPILQKLARVQPGDKLDAPGRGEPITVGKGFRCIATRTVSNEAKNGEWHPPGGWDAWCRIPLDSLSQADNKSILKSRYPKVEDCVERVVKSLAGTAEYIASCSRPLFRQPTLREAVRICERLNNLRSHESNLSVEQAFMESADVLAGWCSAHEHLSHLISIVAGCWSLNVSAAAELWFKHRPDLEYTDVNIRVGRANILRPKGTAATTKFNLAQTGHTLRLLEKTARSLQVGENVLLTGDAGCGKTSVIQELASLTGKKLIVVNLSRQTELGDLIGGFRPVELNAVVPQVAKRFETLFCKCMSKQKNIRFLDALQDASRSVKQHKRALRLMSGAMGAIPNETRKQTSDIAKEWNDISKELENLSLHLFPSPSVTGVQRTSTNRRSRRKKTGEPVRKRPRVSSSSEKDHPGERSIVHTTKAGSRRVEFAFAEGVMVQAMRNGNWILLDEINLAPPELLERLVSIVDRGRVMLGNESGEEVVQSNGFRLFGAMNPPTDVGKRPLPNVLRTRFTEFHVGEMNDVDDLVRFVMTRFLDVHAAQEVFSVSKGEKRLAEDVATLYLNYCSLSRQGDIADTTGKPVLFSLRSLSRMLDFAKGLRKYMTKGLSGARRSLYEAALLTFSTQLPSEARNRVVELAKEALLHVAKESRHRLGNLMDFMSVGVDVKDRVQVLQGFPITSRAGGSSHSQESNFIISPTVAKTLSHVCRALLLGAPRLPVLLQGPTGAGKTSLVAHLAQITGNRLTRINNHEHTEIAEYIGGYVAAEDGSLVFSEGPLVRAARQGDWVLLDELNLAPPDVLESLNRLLDDNRELFIPETGEVVKASPEFRLFATQNPAGLYGGRKELSRAFRSRFVELHVDDLPDEDLRIILEQKGSIPKSFATKMILTLRELQMRRRSTGMFSGKEGYATARDLFRWAARQPRSKEELAMHGFFLLGERSRVKEERETVREILLSTIGTDVEVLSEPNMYIFEAETDVQKHSCECLDSCLGKLGISRADLKEAMRRNNIVSTPSMRRMLILVSHCIANKEPTLLVGATGGGKTSVCSVLACAMQKRLLSVNCHRHTEASDILGGYRPGRRKGPDDPLFVWTDGPLVQAMKEGQLVLTDEINMADDAVIERLNSVLEFERTILLSEKGSSGSKFQPESIVAHSDFRILATMNPSGDFGKKELSPALRNRFTEMWIPPPAGVEEYVPIIDRLLCSVSESTLDSGTTLSEVIVSFLAHYLQSGSKPGNELENQPHFAAYAALVISARDVRAWCEFVIGAICTGMEAFLAVAHGARLIILDGLSVGSSSGSEIELERSLWEKLLSLLPDKSRVVARSARYSAANLVSLSTSNCGVGKAIKVDCFYIDKKADNGISTRAKANEGFSFDAPNVARNVARLARGMINSSRPILLEGPPGSGKSSLITALAKEAGHGYVRVNLSDSTEMSDLVGADAPGELQGAFSFRSGPLLHAMQNGHWLLLDEMNLASQSVLEGLNSVLDHRKSVFVPELNQEITADASFRVFGAQNPAIEGGGRRGLPKSFLNRFTRVQVEAPTKDDVLSIIRSLHPTVPDNVAANVVDVLHELRIHLKERGRDAGGFGLRDALRWCDLLVGAGSANVPFQISFENSTEHVGLFFDVVILQSLKSGEERKLAENCFHSVFGFPWRKNSAEPSVRYNASLGFNVGAAFLSQLDNHLDFSRQCASETLLASARTREFQALNFAINAGWPALFYSGSAALASKIGARLVQNAATLTGKPLRILYGGSLGDEDSFIGGFEQLDLTRSVRAVVAIAGKACAAFLSEACFSPWPSHVVEKLQEACSCWEGLAAYLSEFRSESLGIHHAKKVAQAAARFCDIVWEGNLFENECLHGLCRSMALHRTELEQQIEKHEAKQYASFRWKKSDLVRAVEDGEWLVIQDADLCPPAVLDRLNPLFERPPISISSLEDVKHTRAVDRVILAEAPCEENGSPVYMQPHPDFRIFLTVSKPMNSFHSCGLSRALLDRAMRIFISDETTGNHRPSVFRASGFSVLHESDPEDTTDDVTQAVRSRMEHAEGNTITFDGIDSLTRTGRVTKFVPVTTSGDLVTNPRTALLARELMCLDALREGSSEIVEGVCLEVLEKFSIIKSFVESGMTEAWLLSETFWGSVREDMLGVVLKTYLLDSSDGKDLRNRLLVLQSKLKEGSCPVEDSAPLRKALQQIELVTTLSALEEHASDLAIPSAAQVIPLDPVFSLNSSLAEIALSPKCKAIPALVLERAIKSRFDFLWMLPFREARLMAEATVGSNSGYCTARTQYLLRNRTNSKDGGVPERCISFEEMAYRIISVMDETSGSLLEYFSKQTAFTSKFEEFWVLLFSVATRLCIILARSPEADSHELPALLGLFMDYLHVLSEGDEISRFNNLFGLTEMLMVEAKHLRISRHSSATIAMPRTFISQDIERKLLSELRSRKRADLSYWEIDISSKLLSSLCVTPFKEETKLSETLRKVVKSLRNNSSPLMQDIQMPSLDHWDRISQMVALNALQSTINSLSALNNKIAIPNLSRVSETALLACSQLKCLPSIRLDTIFTVQTLAWILDSEIRGRSPTPTIRNDDFWKGMSSQLLYEKALSAIGGLNSEDVSESASRTTTLCSAALKYASRKCFSSFWNIEESRNQALGAVSLISCGIPRLNDESENSLNLIVLSLSSALIPAENRSEFSSESTDQPLYNSLLAHCVRYSQGVSEFDSSTNSRVRKAEKDAVSCVQRALAFSPTVPLSLVDRSKRIIFFGIAWIAIGLLRLFKHAEEIKSRKGVDPSRLALEVALIASKDIVKAKSIQATYQVIRENRLGGDDVTSSEPFRRLSTQRQRAECVLQQASSAAVHRPSESLCFSAYERLVESTREALTDSIDRSGILARIVSSTSADQQKQAKAEVLHLCSVCESTANSLQSSGPFFHFRDVSVDFALGLREMQYGFSQCFLAAMQKEIILDPVGKRKFDFLSELSSFPLQAFRPRHPVAPMVEFCLQTTSCGALSQAVAELLLSDSYLDNKSCHHDLTKALSTIVSFWKEESISTEEMEEKRNSLYILREVAAQESIPGEHVLSNLENAEESDFSLTFNPIDEEFEEKILGFAVPLEKNESMETNDEPRKAKMSGKEFWNLYSHMYGSQKNFSSEALAHRRSRSLEAIANMLHSELQGIDFPGMDVFWIWELLGSRQVLKQYESLPLKEYTLSDKIYNFYTDGNPPELRKASSSLRDLLRAIARIQRDVYRETGDHPVLNEVVVAIKRVANACRTDTPLARVVLGLENVLRKADEWHRLFATKPARVDEEVLSLAKVVSTWRRLEMKSWPVLINERLKSAESNASRWIFFLYDAIVEDALQVEVRTEANESNVLSTLDRFMRSSPLGEFVLRNRMIAVVGNHLASLGDLNQSPYCRSLGRSLSGLHQFYKQFESGIHKELSNGKALVLKELEEFTKLLSWNAAEELGSSQKMFQTKEKYLEYRRLKLLGEKTRRQLHRLCAKTDSVARKPAYECIKASLENVGYQAELALGKAGERTLGNLQWCGRVRLILEDYIERKQNSWDSTKLSSFTVVACKGAKHILRLDKLSKRMVDFSQRIRSVEHQQCEKASEFAKNLRAAVRSRLSKIRESENVGIQVKQRSLIELFQNLRHVGISPFEKGSQHEARKWLSSPSPQISPDFDTVANELFFTNAKCLQRLREVTDSRVRHHDISQEDANRAKAFCQNLFEDCCSQRESLCTSAAQIESLGSHVEWLLCFNEKEVDLYESSRRWDEASATELLNVYARLRSILVDLDICRSAMQTNADDDKPFGCGVPRWQGDPLPFLHEHHNSTLQKPLQEVKETLSTSAAAIREVVNVHTPLLTNNPEKLSSRLLSGSLERSCEDASNALVNLVEILQVQLGKAEVATPGSVAIACLRPTLQFLRKAIPRAKEKEVPSEKWNGLEELQAIAEKIVEKVLISTQNILLWNDVIYHDSNGLEEKESSEKKKGVLKIANKKVGLLPSVTGGNELEGLLHDNQRVLRTMVQKKVPREVYTSVLGLQYRLGRFLGPFVGNLLAPSMKKAAQFHCESLALLRCLSRVFVGVCSEGFCRPVEEPEQEEGDEEQMTNGAGFGDAGDGDMSQAKNVSDEIEDEEQLVGLANEEETTSPQPQENEKDQEGFEMTTDFEGHMQDVDKEEDQEDGEKDEEKEADREMAPEGGFGDSVVDERLWNDEDKVGESGGEEDDEGNDNGERQNGASELVAKEEGGEVEKSKEEKMKGSAIDDVEITEEDKNDDDGSDSGGENDEKKAPEERRKKKEGDFEDANEEKEEADNEKSDGADVETNENEEEGRPTEENETTSKQDEVADDKGEKDEMEGVRGDVPKGENCDKNDAEEGNQGEEMMGVSEDMTESGDKGKDENEESTGDVEEEFPENMQLDGEGGIAGEESGSEGGGEMDEDNAMGGDDMVVADDGDEQQEEGDGEAASVDDVERSGALDSAKDGENGEEGHDAAMEVEGGVATTNAAQSSGNAVFSDEHAHGGGGSDDVQTAHKNAGAAETQTKEDGDDTGGENTALQTGGNETTQETHMSDYRDPNPLRKAERDVVKEWEQYLDMLEQERDAAGGKREKVDNAEKWEYDDGEEGEAEKHALAAATDEQHAAIENGDGDERGSVDGMDVDEKEQHEQEEKRMDEVRATQNCATVEKKSTEVDGEEDNDQPGDAEDDEGEVTTRQHPAKDRPEMVAGDSRKKNSPVNFVNHNDDVAMDYVESNDDEEAVAGAVKSRWAVDALGHSDSVTAWRLLDARASSGAAMLCEQLRLVLEPTVASRLAGGYRTGKRLNMRKLIEYVASDFRRDRIWLRRTRNDARDYHVLLAVDDSASMLEGRAAGMAMHALALVTGALARLEVGKVAIAKFGECAEIVRGLDEPLPISAEAGGEVLRKFSFSQQQTDVPALLEFIHGCMPEESDAVSLALVVSDGRVSRREEVRRKVRALTARNVVVAFVIVDKAEDDASIFDVRKVDYAADGSVTITPYMQHFPLPFYTVVSNVDQLPHVLADALRQWLELSAAGA